MFEISLTNSKKDSFIIASSDRPGYDISLHEEVCYQDNFVTISGLRYLREKDDHEENDQFAVFISGKIFYQISQTEILAPLSAKEILNDYAADGNNLIGKLKGNFIIIIYNKKRKTLFIAKDQLGLKYLYYESKGDYFYISTNLNDFKRIDYEYNYSAVLEKILFTYPIGEESYIKGVCLLKQGSILSYSDSQLIQEEYFNVENLFPNSANPLHFNKRHFLELFEKSVLQRANAADNLNVSLTGGFDGRANVAVLLKNHRNFRAYSFGKSGGENTVVPLAAAEKYGLYYLPVYLDEQYEKNYSECALNAIYFSDGISTFERANYIYALKCIAEFSNYNITGLIGGEIFAPVHLKTDYLNNTYFKLIYLKEKLDLPSILADKNLADYINRRFIERREIIEKTEEIINARIQLVNKWKKQDYGWMYYLKDLMTLGFQRFYGNQMHLERYFCENLSSFYDLDVIKYLFSTDYNSIYRNAFKNSALARINNRKLQSLIIKEFYPELGEMPVDRGYPPNYNLDFRKVFIPYFYYKRKRKLKNAVPDFSSPSWCQIMFKEKLDMFDGFDNEFINFKIIKKTIADYEIKNYNKDFNHLLSVALWLAHK